MFTHSNLRKPFDSFAGRRAAMSPDPRPADAGNSLPVRRLLLALTAAAAATVLVACGGDDSPVASTTPPGSVGDVPAPSDGGVTPPADTPDTPDTPGDTTTDLPGTGDPGEPSDAGDTTGPPPVATDPDPDATDPDPPADPGTPSTPPPIPDDFQLPPVYAGGDPLYGSGIDTFPLRQIISGGVAKDGIPALTRPRFVSPNFVTYLSPDDLVLGVVIDGVARAYPHNIGWWHEIVNDVIGDQAICVTLCPLTGTGLVFDANDPTGEALELGVSGLLWNNNLIMYDRRDGSTLYPQMFSTAVDGPRAGQVLRLMPVVETTWRTWQRLYPDTRVIESGTYGDNQYTFYPYGDYRTNDNFLLFRLNPAQGSNPNPFAVSYGAKDMVLGVRLDGEARAYPFESMGSQAVINDHLGDVDIVVVWDRASQLAVPFARHVDGQSLTFDIDDGAWPVALRDRETDTLWDVRGIAVEGPLEGQRLQQVPAHNSFWFAWVSFWQETDVWQ